MLTRPSLDSFIGTTQKPSLDSFVAPVTPTPDVSAMVQPTDTSNATFPSTGTESILGGIGKVLGNIPSSALNFAKSAVSFFNPVPVIKNITEIPSEFSSLVQESGGVLNALKTTGKEILPTTYGQLVPKATQQVISGDFTGARKTLQEDPVGQILPFILIGKSAAEKAGVGAQFDSAISKIAKPVTSTIEPVINKVGEKAGQLGSQVLGTATGSGASSVQEAYNAGVNNTQAFTDALRGKINPDEVVQTAQDAVSNIVNQRRSDYISKLETISQQKGSLDISPVVKEVSTQLKNFGIKVKEDGTLDFSRSSIANNGTARNDVTGVFNDVKDWGSQAGDRTPIGLDTLKKQLGDFYSESSSARAFVQAVKSKVTNILKEQVPGYSEMTQNYSNASQLLDDIKSATGIGGKAKVDTIFTKLTSALKGDKELRLEILKDIQSKGAQPDLMAKIAGLNMQSLIPKGLVGKGIDVGLLLHFFDPKFIPVLLSTSPRIVGEFVRALGMGVEKTKVILDTINKLPENTQNILNKNVEDVRPKMGLSVEDVTKSNPLIQEAQKYKSAEEFVKAQGDEILHGTDKKFSSFDKSKIGMNEPDSPTKQAFFFTDSLDTAKSYGNNIVKRYGKFEKPLTTDARGQTYGDFRESLREVLQKAQKEGNDVVIIKNLSDRKDWGNYEPATHYAVIDTNKLLTKSQLTDIWKKANKKQP